MKIRIKRPVSSNVALNAVNSSNNNKNDKVVMEIKDANVAIESIPQPQAI